MTVRCVACNGVYSLTQPDGSRYFHACPEISCLVVVRDGRRISVPIDQVKPTDVVRVRRDGACLDATYADRLDTDRLEEQFSAPRQNARDERTARVVDGKPELVSQGLGVVAVSGDAPLPEFPPLEE